jgi:hypothetical protein
MGNYRAVRVMNTKTYSHNHVSLTKPGNANLPTPDRWWQPEEYYIPLKGPHCWPCIMLVNGCPLACKELQSKVLHAYTQLPSSSRTTTPAAALLLLLLLLLQTVVVVVMVVMMMIMIVPNNKLISDKFVCFDVRHHSISHSPT